MDYFRFLPLEITLDILTRLPTESALECKLVCTNWRSVVGHPTFSKMHLDRLNHPAAESGESGFLVLTHDSLYYLEYDENHDQSTCTTPIQRIRRIDFTSPFEYYRLQQPICLYFGFRFVGSVNVLVCLTDFSNQSVCICNPITNEYLIFPEIKRDCDADEYSYEETSFGYVPSTNEYKVVGFYKSKTHLVVHVYTLGSGNGWRILEKFNYGSILDLKCKIFFANGALYWLCDEVKMIGTFDLSVEKFGRHLSPPPLPPNAEWLNHRIGVLDGFLLFALYDQVDRFHNIWLLKEKNLNHDKEVGEEHQSLVWNEEFRIYEMDLLAVLKSDGVFTYGGKYINLYDTKTSTSKSLVKFKNLILQVSPHTNTLISLKELGVEDTKVMVSDKIEKEKSREQPQEDADPEYIYL